MIKLYNQYEQLQLFKNEFLTHISIELENEFSCPCRGIIEDFELRCKNCMKARCSGECEKYTFKLNLIEIKINQYELLLEKRSIKIPKLYMFDLNIVSMSEKKLSKYYKPQLIEIALDNRTFVDYYKSQEYEDQFHYNE